MSHAMGEVFVGGACVGFFLYGGTCDIAGSRIVDNLATVWDKLHDTAHGDTWEDNERACSCGNPPTKATLYTDYGGGFHWPATACLRCKAIISNRSPYWIDDDEIEPQWPKAGLPYTVF